MKFLNLYRKPVAVAFMIILLSVLIPFMPGAELPALIFIISGLIFGLALGVGIALKGIYGFIYVLVWVVILTIGIYIPLILIYINLVPLETGIAYIQILTNVLVIVAIMLKIPSKIARSAAKAMKIPAGIKIMRQRYFLPEFNIIYEYLRIKNIVYSPRFSVKRSNEFWKLIRKSAAILFLTLGFTLILNAAAGYSEKDISELTARYLVMTGGFFALYSISVIFLGYLRGAAAAVVGAAVLSSVIYFLYLMIKNAFGNSAYLGIVSVLLVTLLFGRIIFDLQRWLSHRNFRYLEYIIREGSLFGVPFYADTRRRDILYEIKLSFEPFKKCEKYYFNNKAADLYRWCRLNRHFFAGFTAPRGNAEVSYYIYAAEKSEAKLRRYFECWRHEAINVVKKADQEYTKYKELLPSHAEAFYLFNALVVQLLKTDIGTEYKVRYNVLFSDGEKAALFAAAAKEYYMDVEEEDFSKTSVSVTKYDHQVKLSQVTHITPGLMDTNVKRMIDLAVTYGGETEIWWIDGTAEDKEKTE